MESGPGRSGDFVVKAYQGGPARDDVVNARGELTFAEQTRMIRGPVPGAERELATPDDDPWYDVPPGPPVLPTQWWQGVHPAHIDRFGVEPVLLPESWYRR